MQSYTLYTTSEFLRDRHPYLPDPNPRPLMDPEQISIAYNERAIPKLAELLVYQPLDSKKRTDALHTLNELVSHQETKVQMINNQIVFRATQLMKDECENVRFEAAYLVGSLLFLDVGRNQFDSEQDNYFIMQGLIDDTSIKVRESVGWLLYRLSLHKDGTMLMNQSLSIQKIVEAFNKYCVPEKLEENIIYLLYLLEAIINCSRYDYNIKQTLNKGLLKSFNSILSDDNTNYSSKISKGYYRQMRELILNACKNITLTFEGKKEAYLENLIITGSKFLNSELEKERLYTSSMMMSVTNILGAKIQICEYTNGTEYAKLIQRRLEIRSGEFPEEEEKKERLAKAKLRSSDFAYSNNTVHYEILEKICVLLEDTNYDIKQNSILCLKNISSLPDGFIKIVDILHDKLELLNEVFGDSALKGLSDLLPKLSTYTNPPLIEKELLPKYTKVIKGLIFFYKKYRDEALDILIHETVNINQKLAPFYLLSDPNLHKWAKYLIERISKKDVDNQRVFQEFLEKYGNKEKVNLSKDGLDSLQLSDFI